MAETSLPDSDWSVFCTTRLERITDLQERLSAINRLFLQRVDLAHAGDIDRALECADLIGLAADTIFEQRVRLACGRPE